MKRWPMAAALMLLAGCSGSSGLDSRTGVSRSSTGEVELHYALCEGERMSMVRAEEHVGASGRSGKPIYWQIESEGAELPEPVIVGSVPDGWTEVVPYSGTLPDNELVGIEATRSGMGMSFPPSELAEGEVLRGTYDSVSLEQFHSDARTECQAMKRGALIAGLLAPLTAAGALAALWRLHRSQPETWTDRQARRGWIWVAAVCGGSFWTWTLAAVRNYEAHVVEIVLWALLAVIPAALAALLVLPIVGVLGAFGRRFLPEGGRRWAAVGGAIAAGVLFWVAICGVDWRWLPLSIGLSLGLVAMIPASELGGRPPTVRHARAATIVVLAGCCAMSALGAVTLLSNSPTMPERDLADYRPADSLESPSGTDRAVLLDERRSGTAEMSLEAPPDYKLFVACDDVSVQVSAFVSRPPQGYGAREVVPCSVHEINGPLGEQVRAGEWLSLKVVAPPDVEWHIVATKSADGKEPS